MSQKSSPISFSSGPLLFRKRIHATLTLLLPPLMVVLAVVFTGSTLVGSEIKKLAVIGFALFCIGQLGITLGYHRLFSHQSFKAPNWIVVMLGIFGSMTAQGPIINWVSDHRRHHAFGDAPGDPHSPYYDSDQQCTPLHGLRGLWHAQAGWIFSNTITNMAKYSPDLIRNKWVLKLSNTYFYWVGLGLLIPTLAGWAWIGGTRGAILGLFYGGFCRLFLSYHITWATNSLGHMIGSRDYNTDDKSTNVLLLGWFGFGEGWHNNHHAFPNSARFGHRHFQFDPGWWVLRLWEKLGLISDINQPTSEQIRRKRKGIE